MDLSDSKLFARDVLPRAELDVLLLRYRRTADRSGPNSKRALAMRNTIVEHNMRLVFAVAKRYRAPRGLDAEDIRAYGVVGLITAIERFEPQRGLAFATYAPYWVRHSIGRALANYGNVVRVPVHALGKHASAQAADDAQAAKRITSLDARVAADDASTFVELLANESDAGALDGFVDSETVTRVRAAIERLPAQHRTVIEARMQNRTLGDIARELGTHRNHVADIEYQAQAMLRKRLGGGERAA